MSALLTADDYWAAAWALSYRVADDRRMLALLGEYCSPEHRRELEAAIAAGSARAERFQQAAVMAESEARP